MFDSTGTGLPNFKSGSFNSGATGTVFTWNGNDELWFQHTQDTWAISLAINQALRSSGIKIDGYSMQMEIFNKNHNTIGGNCLVAKTGGKCLDVLELKVTGYDVAGNQVSLDTFDYSKLDTHNINPSASDPNWSLQNVFSWAPTQLEVANVKVEIFGYDAGYWRGNYGPRVKNMVGSVIYSADICATNPLHDATCPGYVTALFNQQCTSNPLFDPSCTGYAAANLTNQCYANALYDPSCTGYSQAYYDDQCMQNSQYDTNCPNYIDALAQEDEIDVIADALETNTFITDNFIVADIIPDPPEVYVPIVQDEVVEAEETLQAGAAMALEDDIEKEIKQIEAEANEEETIQEDNIEKEIEALENDTATTPTDGDIGTGETKQEDDIEKEIAALKAESNQPVTKKKTLTKNDKIRMLLAQKANELTKKIENAVTLEQQMVVQRQLLALISFVPGFDYNKKKLPQVAFYADKPTVDHAYARWFLNDPKFGAMEDLQYPKLRSN